MIKFRIAHLAFFCTLVFVLASCTGGSNMQGSISGKFSDAGGTIKADRVTLYIPPFSVTVSDEGFDELKGSGKNFEYHFSIAESIVEPPGFIEGSVYSIIAVSEFEAAISSPLTLSMRYTGLPIPTGAQLDDLVLAHFDFGTGEVTELQSKVDLSNAQIQAPITLLGFYYLKVASPPGE